MKIQARLPPAMIGFRSDVCLPPRHDPRSHHAGDRVLTGSKDGTRYALQADSGEEVWRVEHGGWITSAPRVVDGEIYIAERAPDPDGGDADGGGYKLVAEE